MEKSNETLSIPGTIVEFVLLGPLDDRRQLQDSPILGDVWLAYAAQADSRQDLLITPHSGATAARLAKVVSTSLARIDTDRQPANATKIAPLQGILAARLSFEELLKVVVPLTAWYSNKKLKELLKIYRDDMEACSSRVREILDPATYTASASSSKFAAYKISSLDRFIALAALILWAKDYAGDFEPESPGDILVAAERSIDPYVKALLMPIENLLMRDDLSSPPLVFQVSLNRRAHTALEKSVPAVKADAARSLFSVKCDKITWAVLDSGIDRDHQAFRHETNNTPRVIKSMDFTKVRDILSSDNLLVFNEEKIAELQWQSSLSREEIERRLREISHDTFEGRPVNWDLVEELITNCNHFESSLSHGTHVAGIIGANGRRCEDSANESGLCPDILLYDFQVIAKSIDDTEFAIIAALQYIRYVNEQHSYITIHGANLSLSIPHSVRNYACGRTPVCVECERLVDSGVVVVAAAGNRGFQNFQTKEGFYEGYAAFSITDPGNAEGVITVGSTHGNWPHTYGVSFFSSRGPTGDGRLKPDLVAPGERIMSTFPGANEWGCESGTSMAAPHVSGAAAMLMARYPELIGQPRRIKKILCDSATDLGRERTFQGSGMLDVLRAFQAI